jgi:hypothetical protein
MSVMSPQAYASEYLCKMVKALPAGMARRYVARSLATYREVFGPAESDKIRAAALKQYQETHGRKGK